MRAVGLVLVLCVAAAAAAGEYDNRKAAMCVARGRKCDWVTARSSKVCRPRKFAQGQTRACRLAACKFCWVGARWRTWVCKNPTTKRYCYKNGKPKFVEVGWVPFKKGKNRSRRSKPKRSRKRSKKRAARPRPRTRSAATRRSGSCAWRGRGRKVVIDLRYAAPKSAWTRRGGGLVWKKRGGHGIDRMGSGQLCFNVIFPSPGRYFFTAQTRAPHPVDFNDAWFRFSGGFDLYRHGKRRSGHGGYYKGYQNRGRNRMVDEIFTVDFNAHTFVTKYVNARRTYKACLAGRSTKFTVYKMMFVKCNGRYCGRGGASWSGAKCY